MELTVYILSPLNDGSSKYFTNNQELGLRAVEHRVLTQPCILNHE